MGRLSAIKVQLEFMNYALLQGTTHVSDCFLRPKQISALFLKGNFSTLCIAKF